MKEIEDYAPILSREELPERLTTSLLIKNFRAFACNNKAFKGGLSDELTVETSLGDQLPAADEFPPEDFSQIGYKFEALRLRANDPAVKPELLFTLSVIATRKQIELPAYIAIKAYGMQNSEEAVENGGMSDLEHINKFMISTTRKLLAVHESYSYTDCRGDIVNYVYDSSGEGLYEVIDENEDDEDYDEEDESEESLNGESDYLDGQVNQHAQYESLPNITAEESSYMWEQLGAIEDSMGDVFAQQQDEQLLQAFSSFELFKRALRHQLGLE